jgi:protein-tyrosine-phosphatase/peptidoglycan/xylan/chitin deacetylase (PgdA/CDA1 family)
MKENLKADRSDPLLLTKPVLRSTVEYLRPLIGLESWDHFSWRDPGIVLGQLRHVIKGNFGSALGRVRRLRQIGRFRRQHVRTLRKLRQRGESARSVLFVCYGNICRSPFAQHYARGTMPEWEVLSAGFHEKAGRSSPDHLMEAATKFGVELSGHRSQRLDATMVERADLIVLMDLQNFDSFEVSFPAAVSKVASLGLFSAEPQSEIADPYRFSSDETAQVLKQIVGRGGWPEGVRKKLTATSVVKATGGKGVQKGIDFGCRAHGGMGADPALDQPCAPNVHAAPVFPEPRSRCMSADGFARFVDRLGAECELVTVREMAVRLRTGGSSKRVLAAITVDDGYADFHKVALPILKSRGMPATVYATAGFVSGQCWLWWDALRYLLEAQPVGPLRIELPETVFSLELGDSASRDAAWSDVADYLVTRNDERRLVLDQLEASARVRLTPQPTAEYAPMNWEQLRECEAAGVEIGGHTMTHAFLPALDQARLQHELLDAKRLLERQLTRPVTTFAYPNGMPYDWTPTVEQGVIDAGFEMAVLAHPRPYNPEERYRVGRWSADPESQEFGHILSGASVLKLSYWGTGSDKVAQKRERR